MNIRHSSSFFISLVIHTILFILVVITYKTYYSQKKEKCETRICVELRAMEAKKVIQKTKPKQIVKPIIKPKKIEKKIKPKLKPKPKPKKKAKVVKKTVFVPVIKKKPEPEPEIIEEKVIIEDEIVEEQTHEQEVKEFVEEVCQPIEKSPQELENERKIKQEALTKDYVELNIEKISELLRDNLYYPRSARKRGITGKIIIKFRLKTNAEIDNLEVVKSKSAILSRAAMKTIKNLSGKFPKPQVDITLNVPIGYSLK